MGPSNIPIIHFEVASTSESTMLRLLSSLTTAFLFHCATAQAQLAQYQNGAINRYFGSIMSPLTPTVSYTPYKGDGSVSKGWPAQSDWIDWRSMWFLNQDNLIDRICDNSEAETAGLYNAIVTVSDATDVDARFILAVIIEESRGCVRVQSTSLAVTNPGLMQSYQGKGSCASPTLLTPCPFSEILQMVQDGTKPNAAGVDLEDLLVYSNATDVSRFYIAARMYNSGRHSIESDGELSVGGANACYAADIANRLRGYTGGSCGKSG